MNWFERHLNWTWLFAYLLSWLLYALVLVVLALAATFISHLAIYAVAGLLSSSFLLVVSRWVLIQKGRSLWWLLLIGWASPLWLENKKGKPELFHS